MGILKSKTEVKKDLIIIFLLKRVVNFSVFKYMYVCFVIVLLLE